jgi:hypothetical protein
MRSLLLDELMRADVDKLAEHLGRTLHPSALEGVYWLELPPDLLAGEQLTHAQCGPHRVALVLEEESLRLELLVRAQESLRCACTAYATPSQRAFLLGYMDRLIEELGIRT